MEGKVARVQRGSAGMGLPESISPESIAIIQATAAVVAPLAQKITQAFYTNITTKHPQLFAFFNKGNQMGESQQPKALAAAIVAYASNIGDLSPLVVPGGPVEIMAHKHCALGVLPEHYPLVHEFVMGAIAEILGDAVTPEIGAAWSEAVLFLAKVLMDTEEGLYLHAEERMGGWRGLKPFVVSAIDDRADGTKTFTFREAGPPCEYNFSPGQFLTLKVDPDGDGLTAPRHYTVTSAPRDEVLQCTIKKVGKGKVSSYMHDKVRVGDTVDLSPPFGLFTPIPTSETPVVLISAGIGVTPMVVFAKHFGKAKVALAVHVDKCRETHACLEVFEKEGIPVQTHYTKTSGRPQFDTFVAGIIEKVGASCDFYLCGPPPFMQDMQAALVKGGAKAVRLEAFAPQISSGCPMRSGICPMRG